VVKDVNTSYWNTVEELKDTGGLVFNLSITHVTVGEIILQEARRRTTRQRLPTTPQQ
jgi:hypothetical protein